jgi:3',5'-nucleoside bisphosphate phosphatase
MIDLHAHTNQSDGSLSPEELIGEAVVIGLEAIAIADHDTLAGYDFAVPAAQRCGIELVCAVELSTRPETPPGGGRPPSVHLLGYFLNGQPSAEFREWLETQQQSRRRRNDALVAKLQSLGVDITLEEVQVLGRNLTGRPHFARVLCQKGYAKSRQEAFDLYLADNASAAVEREEPTLEEGIRRICAGGGMPSLAHPVRLPQRDRSSLTTLLSQLVEGGLQGLEVYHSEHGPEETELYLALAQHFGLAPTGGSDFHGENKPAVRLGSGIQGNISIPYSLLVAMNEARVPVAEKL